MRTARLAILCALATFCLVDGALAQGTQTAAQHDEQARAYFRAGAFALAAQEFEKAYQLEKNANRLYNAALAYEKAADLRKSSELYGKYLQVEPGGNKATESRARKAALDQAIADEDKLAAEAAARAARERTAQERASAATEHLSAGRYTEAAEALEGAYQANKNVEFLFEKAEALRLAGKRVEAIASYRAYQREAPGGPNFGEARRRQDELEKQGKSSDSTTRPDPSESLTAVEPNKGGEHESSGGPSTLRWGGIVGAGLGVVGLGSSIFVGLKARALERELEALDPVRGDAWDTKYEDKLEDGDAAAKTAQRLAIVGGSLVVGGTILYFLGGSDEPESQRTTVLPTLNEDGAGLALEGWF